MKVCSECIKVSGLNKRQVEIVDKDECEICRMNEYFNSPNPSRKTEKEIIEMYRRGRK